jgi:hypothetical protein
MKSKNLIQYRSRSGITSDGSKIEDMSCYKMLPTIQNKPPKVEYEMKSPNTKKKGYVQPLYVVGTSCWMIRRPIFWPN